MKVKEAVILAGGKSSRMKFDKQNLIVQGERLVEKNIKILKKIFPKITVVTKTPEIYKGLGLTTISDIYPGHGPISGLHSALYHSSEKYIYLTAVDMPHQEVSYIKELDQLFKAEKDGILYKGKYIEPMNAIYNKQILPRLEKQIKEGSFRIFNTVEEGDFQILGSKDLENMGFDEEIFRNLNTQEDLKEYNQLN